MPIPGQSLTVNENGSGSVEQATNIPLHYGYSSLGTANVLKTYSSIPALVAGEGQGAAVEAAAYDLANSGGPIRFMKAATSVAGALSAVTKSGAGPTVTIAGATPSDDYQAILKVVLGGVLGAGTFQYTLDNGVTWSEVQTIPAGGTYAIANTGITVTFPAGTYIAAETYTFTATAPMWNSSDLAAGFVVLSADNVQDWDYIVCSGRQATGSAAATLAAALQTQLTTLANAFRYMAGMIDGGDEATSAILTAFASTVANRVLVAYRSAVLASPKAFPGFGSPKVRLVNAFAQKAHAALISTDLARVKSGPIPGCASIEHNEQLTEVMDAAKISTARTIPNLQGFFLTNGNLKSAVGSDFKFWQHRRVMDVACTAIYAKQAQWYNAGIRTNADGTVFESDAAAIELDIRTTLDALLLQPKNAEGKDGHVSDYRYTINRTTNFQQTGIMLSDFACLPLKAIKYFNSTLGYVAGFPQPAVEPQAA
jgi:hypothetical protein